MKRTVPYHDDWEPFFIAARVAMPKFEDRLTWDGMQDKMMLVQSSFVICIVVFPDASDRS